MGSLLRRLLWVAAAVVADDHGLYGDDDNFVAPTAAGDAAEAALERGAAASDGFTTALRAAAAREAAAWETRLSPLVAASHRAVCKAVGRARWAAVAWAVADGGGGALPPGGGLPEAHASRLEAATQTLRVPLGASGVALVALATAVDARNAR